MCEEFGHSVWRIGDKTLMHESLYAARPSIFMPVVLTIVSTLLIALDCVAQQAATKQAESQQPAEPRWKSDIFENTDAFRALFKPGTYGARASEVFQWMSGDGLEGGQARIAQLQEAIRKYPNSPYVDDAALLLARASFLYGTDTVKGIGVTVVDPDGNEHSAPRAFFVYGHDAETAIAGLYDVIKKHPNADWVAEDPIMLRDIAVLMNTFKRRGKAALSEGTTEYMHEVMSYMEYVSEHPNRTSDEAKLCIAWIIFKTRKEQRYQEAEDLLRSVIARYRDAARTQVDLEAAKHLKNKLIETVLPRTEREASDLLIALLEKQGKNAAAVEAAEEYARLYKGHPSVKDVLQNAQRRRTATTRGADSS